MFKITAMRQLFFCVILLICASPLFGQVTLSGLVTGKDNQPAFEALILLYSRDTFLIKTKVIDKAGRADDLKSRVNNPGVG